MTDAMFEMLYAIEDKAIESEKEEIFPKITNEMEEFNNEYSIKKSLLSDESKEQDGGIEFELTSFFSKYFSENSEKL